MEQTQEASEEKKRKQSRKKGVGRQVIARKRRELRRYRGWRSGSQ